MGDSAPDYIDAMVRNVVGIEITLETLQGKLKLSQNREDRDRLHAAETLQARGQLAMASAMRNPKPD